MITPLQRRAMVFIEAEIARTGGVAPTICEIAANLKTASKGNVHRLIKGLEERGFIRRAPGRARGIEVIRPVSRLEVHRFNPETKEVEAVTEKEKSLAS